MTTRAEAMDIVGTIFGRLFENEFATLDDIAISCRCEDGFAFAEGTDGLRLWLEDEISAPETLPVDGSAHEVHAALLAEVPGHEAVISGCSRHLRALLLEGRGTPPATSMLRNRGVPDIGAHLVAAAALEGPALRETIERAGELAERNGMRHLLIVSDEGLVVVSGAPPFEAMAHWHNIELASRVECLRIEETRLEGTEVERW